MLDLPSPHSDQQCPINGTRYFWLSFVDMEKPPGLQAIGAAIVPLTGEDIEEARLWAADKPMTREQLTAAAVMKKATVLQCNPGGELLLQELLTLPSEYPIGSLMTSAETKDLLAQVNERRSRMAKQVH